MSQMKTGQTRLAYLQSAMRYCRRQYNQLRDLHCHCSFSARDAMLLTESKFTDIGTFGVEGFAWSTNGGLSYLNTGDAYELTITFRSDTEQFRITSYGDFVERNPKLCSN